MLRAVSWPDFRLLLEGAGATFLRVNAALLISALWTIPVGVAIGFNPRLGAQWCSRWRRCWPRCRPRRFTRSC